MAVGAVAALGIALVPRARGVLAAGLAGFGIASIIAAPAAYSLTTAATPHCGAIPSAGPAIQGGGGFGGPGGRRLRWRQAAWAATAITLPPGFTLPNGKTLPKGLHIPAASSGTVPWRRAAGFAGGQAPGGSGGGRLSAGAGGQAPGGFGGGRVPGIRWWTRRRRGSAGGAAGGLLNGSTPASS